MNFEKDFLYENKQEVTNGAVWSFSRCWEYVIYQYGLPFIQYCIGVLYAIYLYCTPINVALFLVKSVPTVVYVYNFVKSVYVTSRERLKQKQLELEDIQLQIQIVNTKLSVRDVEFTERAEELRRGTERLRKVRARVREVIASDEELSGTLHETTPWEDPNTYDNPSPEEHEFIVQLLKEMKYDQVDAEGPPACEAEGEPDADAKQNCRVKIVKVTNVYKVAYLKHYIKQKRLRRATRQAVLKKKMENVKKLLDDWHKTLNMVINNNLSILNIDSQFVDMASQEAMGDYPKQDFREFSDTDSDFRNYNDNYYEQSGLGWVQNSQRNFTSSFEDASDMAGPRGFNEPQHERYHRDGFHRSECSPRSPNILVALPEETSSQVAIAEARSEASEENDCRDIGSI